MSISNRLSEFGVDLGKPIAPIANYIGVKMVGSLVYVSGQLPIQDGKVISAGKVGQDVSIEEAKFAAEICVINVFTQLAAALNDKIEKIISCVKLEVFINCNSDFEKHSEVANGASDFMVKILEGKGRHARFAVGVNSLPLNASVEVCSIFEVAHDISE